MTLKSRINNAITAFKYQNQISYYKSGNNWINGFSSISAILTNTSTPAEQIQAFYKCPALNSIISKKIRYHLNGKYYFLDNNGKEVVNPYSIYLKKLFEKPNCLQTWLEFESQAKMYIQIFGECFILPLYPVGFTGNKKSIDSLYVIPNWIVTSVKTGKHFSQSDINNIIDYYQIGNVVENVTVKPSDIINIKDFYYSKEDTIDSYSRMVTLQDPISNIIAAYEARNVLISKKGAIGILSEDNKDPMDRAIGDSSERDRVQSAFAKYGLTKDTYQVIVTNANLKWQSMTFPTKDLMLFEEIEDSTRAIAEVYELPHELTGFKSGASLSNGGDKREAKLGFYQDTIIPESESFYLALTNWFETEKLGKFTIKVFYDHLYIFKKDIKLKADAVSVISNGLEKLYLNQFVTREEVRKELANYIDIDPINFEGNTFYSTNSQ